MINVIYGIDPDSDRHGVSVWRRSDYGKFLLCELLNVNTIQLYKHLTTFEKQALSRSELEIHMENPLGVKGVFSQRTGHGKSVDLMIAQKTGMVKQAQRSLMQMADELGVKYVLHKNSGCWKKGAQKTIFERVTGWHGRSNEETRSGAYMGWLGTNKAP